MSRVLAIVPARGASKGVPDKNIRPLAGRSLIEYAAEAAHSSGVIDRIVLTTDSERIAAAGRLAGLDVPFLRPAELAADETPMLAVVRHALDEMMRAGWLAEYVLLLQPTSPLRKPDHIRQALTLLQTSGADSVVTVVELPRHLSPDYLMRIEDGVLRSFLPDGAHVTRRQDARPAYSRDGTVYAFRRDTIERYGTIYGKICRPLIVAAEESLSIDSQADWEEAERVLLGKARRAGLAL